MENFFGFLWGLHCFDWVCEIFVTVRVVLFPIVIYRLVDFEIGFAGELRTLLYKKEKNKFKIWHTIIYF